jgi:peptide/nickel transport system substrate-binding protein
MSEVKGEFLPAYYSTTNDGYIVRIMFDRMFTNDTAGGPVPEIATSWELSNENKTYTFHLRDDVKFWDGTPLTAKDVAFTFTALCDPAYDGRYFSEVEELVGYDAYKNGDADHVAGIEVIDDYTISFTYDVAKAARIWNLEIGIMPEHFYGFEKGGAQSMRDKMNNMEIMGSGRYMFKAYEPKQFTTFTANENWYGGEVKTPNLITKQTSPDTYFQEMQAGTIDVQVRVPAKEENKIQIEEMGFMGINPYMANSYGYIGFNLRDERLADKQVRQALTYGFNREAFIQIYFNGNASLINTPISKVSWAYTDEVNPYNYDMEKAIAMLDEAGWVDTNGDGTRDKNGQELQFVWDTYTDSRYVETMIPMLQADWKKIGVGVEANLMDFSSLVEKVYTERDFDLYNMAWSLTTDPGSNYSTFHSNFDVTDGNNSVGLRNEKIDELLIKGDVEFDQEARKAIYKEFALAMNEELPYMFLSQGQDWDAVNARIQGYHVTPYENWAFHVEDIEIVE